MELSVYISTDITDRLMWLSRSKKAPKERTLLFLFIDKSGTRTIRDSDN